MALTPPPEVILNDGSQPIESPDTFNTPGNGVDFASLRKGKDYFSLCELLRNFKMAHMDKHNCFWPDQILRQLLTRRRIREELEMMRTQEESDIFEERSLESYVDHILPDVFGHPDVEKGAENGLRVGKNTMQLPQRRSYLRIFAILVICERNDDIELFIDEKICDDDLPLITIPAKRGERAGMATMARPSNKLKCFKRWKNIEVENFEKIQYQVMVPYFGLPYDSSSRTIPIRHAKYHDKVLLPYIGEQAKAGEGAYGEISCIRVHPLSHGFHGLDQVVAGNGKFALKRITTETKDFDTERKNLLMFSGQHDHIVRLLMTYVIEGSSYLLFPWADCNLSQYWERNSPPYDPHTKQMDPSRMEWVASQILGLVSALHKLHNPGNIHLEVEQKYARHGDLKPDNILWFNYVKDGQGTLVIGDLGISAVHRKESRSNIPNQGIPRSPDYRPPECDQDGGGISRAFDVWTLGCLLLEMVCWVLGGNEYVTKFDMDRSTVAYIGIRSNIFFDVKKSQDGEPALLVKDVVSQWIYDLHKHPGCTDYLHSLLDIIQEYMLIVISQDADRILSGDLLEKIEDLHSKVKTSSYGQQGKPKEWRRLPVIAIESKLNDNAQERFDRYNHLLETHGGLLQKCKPSDGMRRVQ